MRVFNFILLWIVLTVVMMVSWSFGFTVGNAITHSSPPPLADASAVAMAFLAVCTFNSLLVSLLVWKTNQYTGAVRWMALLLYGWIVQFVLPQMETFFFVDRITMSIAQIVSIVVAGAVMSLATVSAGILVAARMNKADPKQRFSFRVNRWGTLWLPLLALTVIVYPLIYLTFGYFVAWQSDAVRIFYTHSTDLYPFWDGLVKALTDGVYLYQVLRASLWVMVSLPLIVMLHRERFTQYILLGILSALLPSTLLFIPNPYMPADVAMTHFVETASSNFLWGIAMVFCANRAIRQGGIVPLN